MENTSPEKKEADDSAPRSGRKSGLKFAPKVPSKGASKIVPKKESRKESKDVTIDKKKVMKRLRCLQSTDAFGSRVKAEKQDTHIQVTFEQADPSIPRTFLTPRTSSTGVSIVKLPKEHDEPWDSTHIDCPIILPLRGPYSGDPAILNEEESRRSNSKRTSAEELGLTEWVDKPPLLLFQLPASLPLPRQTGPVADTDKKDTEEYVDVNSKSMGNSRKRKHHTIRGCNMKELPSGLMGKILVYRSGKVKMRLGDTLFDVSAGLCCSCVQEAASFDTKEKHCCSLGVIGKRAIVTPDFDSVEKIE